MFISSDFKKFMIKLNIQDFKNLQQIIILFYHNNVCIWQTYPNIRRKG